MKYTQNVLYKGVMEALKIHGRPVFRDYARVYFQVVSFSLDSGLTLEEKKQHRRMYLSTPRVCSFGLQLSSARYPIIIISYNSKII